MKKLLVLLLLLGCAHTPNSANDPYLYMEDMEGKKALDWVEAQNKISKAALASDANYKKLDADALKILQSKDRIPYVSFKHKNLLQNFWQDETHVRGILRETTLANYKKKIIPWTTVLDVDALAKKENENWIYHGMDCLRPEYKYCVVNLSRGGKDASVTREFDGQKKVFVSGGFEMPEAKSGFTWIDKDTALISTDFGPGSMTKSGYPRTVRLWKRGTKMSEAKTVFEGVESDVSVRSSRWERGDQHLIMLGREIDTFTTEDVVYDEKTGDKKTVKKPAESDLVGFLDGQFILQVRKPWKVEGTTFESGTVVSFPVATAGRDIKLDDLQVVFVPKINQAFEDVTILKTKVIVSLLEDVKSKQLVMEFASGKWTTAEPLNLHAGLSNVNVGASTDEADVFTYTVSNFNVPNTLYVYEFGKGSQQLKSSPSFFDSMGVEVDQRFATSQDGTKVPYFLVYKKSVKFDGTAPTLQYGYGGFFINMIPSYNALVGKLWIERGGVYVLANIRGGAEYGPKWHDAALKENRQRAYDDFEAVSQDLIATKVTSAKHLGIHGGSNGGLLVGTVMVQRPDLYGAVVCDVPLLDMIRYPKIGAGASWMGEYGDPEIPIYHRAIMRYSPYQNVREDKQYPPVLFVTSTKDDRVHPAHARKMAAKMEAQKHDVLFFENTEGGHGAAANAKQRALINAIQYNFLWQKLGDKVPVKNATTKKPAQTKPTDSKK